MPASWYNIWVKLKIPNKTLYVFLVFVTIDQTYAWNTIPFEENLIKIHRVNLGHYTYRLYQLNPHINRWFILEIKNSRKTIKVNRFHLENPNTSNSVRLDKNGLIISNKIDSKKCFLWGETGPEFVSEKLKNHTNPYYSLCNSKIYLRLRRNSKTKLSMTEWSTSLLRKTSFGESIINIVKPIAIKLGAESADVVKTENSINIPNQAINHRPSMILSNSMQKPMLIDADNHDLGIEPMAEVHDETMYLSHWYRSKMHKNIFVSLYLPSMLPTRLQSSKIKHVWPIIESERASLVYATSYDLSKYGVRFISGTTQPLTVDSTISFGKANFLHQSIVRVGNIPPFDMLNSVAVFIGGFKTRHSTIREGPHKGKTYGFIEGGVSLNPLQPGLATLFTTSDHAVRIDAWPSSLAEHQKLRIKTASARQNGVLILQDGKPTPLVKSWRGGNWSADVKGMRQSLRSGVCISKNKLQQEFLIFFAFTLATPSTMARVMQAYDCDEAMHLDMNALMYLHNAIFKLDQETIQVEYLHKEMRYPPKLKRHRYILDNNLRDFFYVYRK